MSAAIENIRRALIDLALPAEAQLALFPGKNEAVIGLTSLLNHSHDQADLSRSTSISLKARQAIDELLWELNSPVLGMDSEGNVWDIGHKDEFLQTSEFWIDVRLRAKEALSLLDSALEPDR